jgi:dTDP-4-amino-4,6-dideoxygalactose transaminase
LEDAAQAHGAFDVNTKKKAGAFGYIAGFSFYTGKNLGCFGDGGAIATNDDNLAEELRKLRNYGSKTKYKHEIIGINSRLDELQAGVLMIKLDCLDEWNERRSKIAKIYIDNLKGVGDLILPEYCNGHVWHIFAVRTGKRDGLKDFLEKNEIGVNIHYPTPIHLQEAYKYLNYSIGDFSTTEKVCSEVLSLPIGPHIDNDQIMFCIKKIKEFFTN